MRLRHTKVTASVDTGMSYWYLFKHGLGPGTMPKGVNVLKVMDDGWKDYVLLDRMLTTAELNEYEIKEATPPDDLLAENGYSSLEETYQEFGAASNISPSVPAPYDQWYEVDNSGKADEYGSPAEELEGYEAKHLGWAVAKEEYFDALSDNGLEYCEILSEAGGSPFLGYVVHDRLYPVSEEEIYDCISDDESDSIEFSSKVKCSDSWNDRQIEDEYTDTHSSYYVTPEITESDLDFAAQSVVKYLNRRNLGQVTTEDVIDELRSMSDMWDEYWAYGLRTKEQSKAFLADFLDRCAKYGLTNVTNNTFEDIFSSTKIEGSWDNPNIFDFYGWYNNLTLKQRNKVDDWCDEWGYPLYDDCSREELSTIHDHFESEFAQADESNFHVAAFGNDFNELQNSIDTDDPKKAIQTWLNWQGKYPMDVMITGYAKGEQILRDYVTAHPDWFRAASAKSKSPYDPEYIISECAKPSRMKPSEYTDQLHPFGLG